MTFRDSLLTAEASPAERAVEAASAAAYPLDWAVLRTLQNADAIPEDKLAILAWAMSVDIWDSSWPIEKRRSVVRNAIADHRLKGTLAGIRRYLAIEDAKLLQHLAPPQGVYAAPGLTKAELEAWFETMPQLRIRHKVRQIVDPAFGLMFLDADFLDLDFAGFDEGEAYYGRQAFLYDRGEEVPLRNVRVLKARTLVDYHQTEQASVPGVIGESALDADFLDLMFYDATVLAPEIYTYRLDGQYVAETSELAFDTIPTGLDPIDARYQRSSDIVDIGAAFCMGDFYDLDFVYGQDRGEFMVFDCIYLHDTARAVPFMEAVSFFDVDRYGMPDFTFELMVDVPLDMPPDAAVEGDFLDVSFFFPTDVSKIERATDAVELAKSYRDRGLITFETTRPRTWGDGLPLDGSYRIGDRVPSTL